LTISKLGRVTALEVNTVSHRPRYASTGERMRQFAIDAARASKQVLHMTKRSIARAGNESTNHDNKGENPWFFQRPPSRRRGSGMTFRRRKNSANCMCIIVGQTIQMRDNGSRTYELCCVCTRVSGEKKFYSKDAAADQTAGVCDVVPHTTARRDFLSDR
jgi:hypothetical protein